MVAWSLDASWRRGRKTRPISAHRQTIKEKRSRRKYGDGDSIRERPPVEMVRARWTIA